MTSTVNRRTFLGSTAAVAATSLAGTARGAAANDKVVVGVMGLSRGRSLSVSFSGRPNVEVKYVADVDSNRAAACAKLVAGTGAKPPTPIAAMMMSVVANFILVWFPYPYGVFAVRTLNVYETFLNRVRQFCHRANTRINALPRLN